MAHTYDTTTDIGKVRLLIGDTDIVPTTDAQFSDEEIQVFLDLAGSVLGAAAKALEAWAATLADGMLSEKIGDYSYTKLATSETEVLTGVDKADMLLRHYVKRKAKLMAP